jgi:hypothetical protein
VFCFVSKPLIVVFQVVQYNVVDNCGLRPELQVLMWLS